MCTWPPAGATSAAHSPRQVKARPDDPAAAGGGLDAPAVRAGERFDHVQAVRAVVGLPAAPGAAEVFGLDPDVIGVQLGADGEELAPAGRVDDRVGRQFGHDQDQRRRRPGSPPGALATARRTWCTWSARPG